LYGIQSITCQRKDWKEHKLNCSVLPDGVLTPAVIEPKDELESEVRRVLDLLNGIQDSWKVGAIRLLIYLMNVLPLSQELGLDKGLSEPGTNATAEERKARGRIPLVEDLASRCIYHRMPSCPNPHPASTYPELTLRPENDLHRQKDRGVR
jgi:hypothetical protein